MCGLIGEPANAGEVSPVGAPVDGWGGAAAEGGWHVPAEP
jgi:hypothetical protein